MSKVPMVGSDFPGPGFVLCSSFGVSLVSDSTESDLYPFASPLLPFGLLTPRVDELSSLFGTAIDEQSVSSYVVGQSIQEVRGSNRLAPDFQAQRGATQVPGPQLPRVQRDAALQGGPLRAPEDSRRFAGLAQALLGCVWGPQCLASCVFASWLDRNPLQNSIKCHLLFGKY